MPLNSQDVLGVATSIEVDAQEFGMHLRQGGWRLGLLVARDVEPGAGSGTRTDLAVDHGRGSEDKVSAERFAELTGRSEVDDRRLIGPERVMRYYRAWERAAAKGKVPRAADLSPGDEPDLNWKLLPPWKHFFSELPPEPSIGPLKLRIRLGHFADRQLKAHKRLVTFIDKELPEQRLDKETRTYAGRLASLLEAEAAVLREVEGSDVEAARTALAALDPEAYLDE